LYYFSREAAWNEALGLSHGATPTSRNRLKEEKFLSLRLPLPPIDEQLRIVGRINRIAAKIDEVHRTKLQLCNEQDALLRSKFFRIVDGAPRRKMADVAPLVRRKAEIVSGATYPELGIRSFGKGTFHKAALDSISVGSKKLYQIEPGDLVFNNVFAWEGAIAVAQREDAGRFGSHRFITCVPIEGVARADFLCFYFLTSEGLDQIGKASPGGAGRNRTLGLEKLADIEVLVPKYLDQINFANLLQKMHKVQATQETAAVGLDAMLPSILDRAFRGEL
jgi:type I restriction enzyme S subunit